MKRPRDRLNAGSLLIKSLSGTGRARNAGLVPPSLPSTTKQRIRLDVVSAKLQNVPSDRAAGWAVRRLPQRAIHRTSRSKKSIDQAVRQIATFCEVAASV